MSRGQAEKSGLARVDGEPFVDGSRPVGHAALMSYAEIVREVNQLDPSDCERLAAHLRLLALLRDPEHMSEMERRTDDAERGVNLVSKEELFESLRAAGRKI